MLPLNRYGRKFVLILGTVGSGIFGILRMFASNYAQFATFEFFDSFFGAATYSTSFIIGLELVTPKHRTVFGTCLNCFYAFGEIYLGIIAMLFRNYKEILLITYIPAFLALAYVFILPQSQFSLPLFALN
jgi:OCT family organic cation transporter-like MFS transporter 4/5